MKKAFIRRMVPELRAANYELVHIQTPFVAHYAGLDLARRLDVPVVTTYHTFFEEYLHHYARMLPPAMTRALARRFSRGQCNETDGVIAPSHAMRDALVSYGVTVPIEVIPTGIPLAQFSGGDGARFRAQHGLGHDREIVLFVGRVAHEKNIELLLHVAAIVSKLRPNFLLIVAGEGPALNHLRALAHKLGLQQHIRFVGYLDRTGALLHCYAAANIFAFASTTETQGLVLLEAMAMGLPVVAIPAMGARNILSPEQGCLCARNEPGDFADKLVQLLTQPDLARRKSAEAASFAKTWSAPATAERLADFYRGVLVRQLQLSTKTAAALT